MKKLFAVVIGCSLLLAGGNASALVFFEDFNSGIPGAWSVLDGEGNGVVWTDIVGSGELGNYTGGSGDAATVSSDVFGTAEFDTWLVTPTFGLEAAGTTDLSYLANYQNFANFDFLDVDITADGGGSWTNLLSWNEDHGIFRGTPGEAVNIDLVAYQGMNNLNIRWRYYDPNTDDFDWYAQIDDVMIQGVAGTEIPEPATLILGLVGLGGYGLRRIRRK